MLGDIFFWYKIVILSFASNLFVNVKFFLNEDMTVAAVIAIKAIAN